MKFSLLLKITIYTFDLKKMVIPGSYEVSTFTLVHHSFLVKCWGLEIDRNRRHSFAGRHFELLKTKVNERHLARFCIATMRSCSDEIKNMIHDIEWKSSEILLCWYKGIKLFQWKYKQYLEKKWEWFKAKDLRKCFWNYKKMLIEKSRECNNHTKRKRKMTKTNMYSLDW